MKTLLLLISTLFWLPTISQTSQEDDSKNLFGINTGLRISPGSIRFNSHLGLSWRNSMNSLNTGVLIGRNASVTANIEDKAPRRIVGGYISYDIAPFKSMVKFEPIIAIDGVFNRYKNAYTANPTPIDTRIYRYIGCYISLGVRYRIKDVFSLQPMFGVGLFSSKITKEEPGLPIDVSLDNKLGPQLALSFMYFFLR